MAIQGIIQGFANPDDMQKNVVMVGRGPDYVLLVDGEPVGKNTDLSEAYSAFHLKKSEHCLPNWRQVQGLETSNVGTKSIVTKVGGLSVADFSEMEKDE